MAEITLRQIVIVLLFTFIVYGTITTMREEFKNGGNLLTWLDGFFE